MRALSFNFVLLILACVCNAPKMDETFEVIKQSTKTSEDRYFCYYLTLSETYKDPANWTEETRKTINTHAEWLQALGEEGKLIFAGRTLFEPGDERLFGIAVVKAATQDEAEQMLSGDPAVVAGIQVPKVLPY